MLGAALPVRGEAPGIVTDIPPVHSLVSLVLGEAGAALLLLEPGTDEHSFQLRPSQTRALAKADLVFFIGGGLTPWLDRALATPATGQRREVALIGVEGTRLRSFAEGGGTDPHAWLDAGNALQWLERIAAELAAADPANAALYAANAGAARGRIAALDLAIAARLTPLAGRGFATQHEAYGYFADRYGLTIAGALAAGDAAPPGAARLSALRRSLEGGAARCAFPDAGENAGPIEALAEDAGLRLGPPLDAAGATLPPGPAHYEALLGAMAAALEACLGAP